MQIQQAFAKLTPSLDERSPGLRTADSVNVK
jgi:hypothetical protein